MAKIPKGILGPISGKIGPVVACNGKQGQLARALPKPRPDKPTEAQLAQRKRFGIISKFLTPMRDLLRLSFATDFIAMEPFNLAASYNMKNAVCGVYPDYYIDYSQVWISYGLLPAAVSAAVSSVERGKLQFTWTDNSGQGKASKADKTILVAYCEGTGIHYSHRGGAERAAGAEILDLSGCSGRKVHAWLGFISKDGKDISPGIYVGEVMVE